MTEETIKIQRYNAVASIVDALIQIDNEVLRLEELVCDEKLPVADAVAVDVRLEAISELSNAIHRTVSRVERILMRQP